MPELDPSLLFRRLVGLKSDEAVWVPAVFTKLWKLAKAIYQGGDLASAFADNIQQVRTLANPVASDGAKLWAGAQLLITIVSPVDVSDVKGAARLVSGALGRADDVGDAVRSTGTVTRFGGDAAQAVHGNSRLSTRVQHRYEIVDESGDVVKTGISGQPLNANGSPRANRQVNSFNRANDGHTYSARIAEPSIPGRAAALEAERSATTQLSVENNTLRLQQLPKPKPVPRP